MAQTVFANNRGVDHKGSGGQSTVFPDVCKTPIGNAIVPIPYANTGFASTTSKGPKKVKIDGSMPMAKKSVYSSTIGDEPGTAKGVASGTQKDEAEYMLYSFDVQMEGRNACRQGDMMFHNKKNIVG